MVPGGQDTVQAFGTFCFRVANEVCMCMHVSVLCSLSAPSHLMNGSVVSEGYVLTLQVGESVLLDKSLTISVAVVPCVWKTAIGQSSSQEAFFLSFF